MKRPNITPGNWTAEPAMEKQDCGIRIHTPESAAYGMAHIYSPGANVEANARAIASVPKLLGALEEVKNMSQNIADSMTEVGFHPYNTNRVLDLVHDALIEAGYTFD